jgi:methylenetetrahydrofolate reductase (NADPH)
VKNNTPEYNKDQDDYAAHLPWRASNGVGAVATPPETDLSVSFEFFPPKTEKAERTLWESIERLSVLAPRFVSVTYGAGGSTRERTHKTVQRVLDETALDAAAHLTSVAATRDEVDAVARRYWQAGIRHIVALRGDPPDGESTYRPHPGGYTSGADLVSGLSRVAPFELSVAAYPETHPDAASPRADIDNLKRKIDNGAVRAITQFFFDNDVFFRFMDRVRDAGIDVPVVPGIMPVSNVNGLLKFAAACGADVPKWVRELFDGLDEDPQTRRLVAATVAAEQCARLREQGVKEFHFYTLNRAELTYAVCHMLGMRPVEPDKPETASEWRARA